MSAHIPPPPPEARRQPISRKETTAVYGQIRATLLNNRVLYATSKKSILAARDVLEVTPELRQERLRVEQDLVASGHDVPVQSDAEDDEGDPASDTAASRAARREVAYKAAQLETRTFLCECLNRIVGILLDQFPMRVELRYQEIINVCLFESTYVAINMLEHADTREAGVSVILSLLDPTKNYYTGGKDAYLRTPNAGLMKIMDQCLLNMLRQGRFNVFLTAFMNPTASAAAASSAVPAGSTHVTAAAALKESAPAENTEGDNPAVSMWRGAAQMATFYNVLRAVALKVGYTPSTFSINYHMTVPNCIRWGRTQFLSLSDDVTKKEDTDDVGKMLRAFEKAADACSFSYKLRKLATLANSPAISNISTFKGCAPGSEDAINISRKVADFFFEKDAVLPDYYGYDFWLQAVSKYLKCGSLPQRLFAMDQIASLESRAARAHRVPPRIRVNGAGLTKVDGVYKLAGKHANVDKWYCEQNGLTIFRCSMDNGTDFNWFISKADKVSPGTANDTDYYTAKVRDPVPPTMGWTSCNKVVKPYPLIIKEFDDVGNADAGNVAAAAEFKDSRVTRKIGPSRHAMLLRWIRTEQLLEEVVGDRIHKQMLARAGPLLHTLASAGALTIEELRRMWERAASLHTATDDTTSGLAMSILQLVRSTIEFLPPVMLEKLLGMVSQTAFPVGPRAPCSGAAPGYATAVEFMKMLKGIPALLLVAKGEAPGKSFITLLHNLLSVPRAAGDAKLLKNDDGDNNNDADADARLSTSAADGSSQNGVTAGREDAGGNGARRANGDADAGDAAENKQAEAIVEAETARKEALRQVIMPDPVICGLFQTALRRSQTLGARYRKAFIAMVCKLGLRASMNMDGGGERELDDDLGSGGGLPIVEEDPAGVLVREAFFSRQLSVLQVLLESYPKGTRELGEELHRLSGSNPGGSIAEEGGIVNDLIDEFVAYSRRARARRFDSVGDGRGSDGAISGTASESSEPATKGGSRAGLLSKERQLHLLLISRRLVVIRAVTEKMYGPRLSVAQIDRIYSSISRGGASRNAASARPLDSQRETDLFMDWLAKSISTTKTDSRSVLSQSAIRSVFMERLCSTNASIGGLLAHPERMTLAAWKCFHALFCIVNNIGEDGAPIVAVNFAGGKSHALLQAMKPRHDVRNARAVPFVDDVEDQSKDPEGLHVLWNAVLRANDDEVADAAGEFLLKICTAAMKEKNSQRCTQQGSGSSGERAAATAVSSTEAFLEKVFGRLESEIGEEASTTKTTTRCLRLLSRFVKVSRDAAADAKAEKDSTFSSGMDDYLVGSRSRATQDASDDAGYAAVPHGASARGTDMTVHLTGRRQLKPGERASSKQDHHSVTSISGGHYSSQSRAPSMKNLDHKTLSVHSHMRVGTLRKFISVKVYEHVATDQYKSQDVSLRLLGKESSTGGGKLAAMRLRLKKKKKNGKSRGAASTLFSLSSITDRSKDHLTLAQAGLVDNCRIKVSLLNPTSSNFEQVFTDSTGNMNLGPAAGEKINFSFGDTEVLTMPDAKVDSKEASAARSLEKSRPGTPDWLISQSERFSGTLFSILENSADNGAGGLAWQLLMDIPSVSALHSSVQSLATKSGTAEENWSAVLRGGSILRTVYVFQILDALLSPASGMSGSIVAASDSDSSDDDEQESEAGKESKSSATADASQQPTDISAWARAFCGSGGFSAVCSEITEPDGQVHGMPPQGWKALVRIIRVCLVGDPSLASEGNAPELASHLLALVNTSYEGLKSETTAGQTNEDVQAMVDASLDALIVVKLLLGSTASENKSVGGGANLAATVRAHVFSIPALPTLLTEVQLFHPSAKVRQATSAFARELALEGTEDVLGKGSSRCQFVFDTMFSHIIGDAVKVDGSGSRQSFFNSTCEEYFGVLESLIPVLRRADQSRAAYSWANSATVVAQLLSTLDLYAKECASNGGSAPYSNTSNAGILQALDADSDDQDASSNIIDLSSMFGGAPTIRSGSSTIKSSPFLIGILSCLSECFRGDAHMISETLGPRFVEKVFNKYLYSVPTISDKYAWPVCRGSAARKQGFRLLYHLTEPDGDDSDDDEDEESKIPYPSFYGANRGKLAELVRAYRATVSMDKIGWKVSPSAVKKETAFAGLVNQGCTCYMNATLQQLYLIRSIRDNVLSAPLSPIVASRARELIDFEAVFAHSAPEALMATATAVLDEDDNKNIVVAPLVPSATLISGKGAAPGSSDGPAVAGPSSLVNKKVEVQWESGKWYSGEIKMYDENRGTFTLVYEDGEHVEWDPRRGRPTKEKPGVACISAPDMNEEEQAQQVLEMTRTVFRFLKDSQRRSYDPKGFVESCKALKMEFGPYQQNDSAEFLALLMDRIETGLKSNPVHATQGREQMAVLTHTMKGETVKMMNYECADYGNHTKRRYGEEVVIPLKVTGGVKTLERALEEYTKPEIMEGDNKCECDECRQQMEEKGLDEEIEAKAYKRRTELRDAFNESRIPNVLVLSLRRFELDFETFETVKRNDSLEFPQVLNMYKYTQAHFDEQRKMKEDGPDRPSAPANGEEETKAEASEEIEKETAAHSKGLSQYDYQLRGCVIHAGVAGAGHYWSLGRTRADYNRGDLGTAANEGAVAAAGEQDEATWYKFDDDNVTPFREEDLAYEAFGGVEPSSAGGSSSGYYAEQQRERSTNAVMLFYERINPVAIKSKSQPESGDPESGDGNAVEDAATTSDVPITTKDQSAIEVWDDNESHVRMQHLFDKEYAAFLLRCLVSSLDKTSDSEKAVVGADATAGSDTIPSTDAGVLSTQDSFLISCVGHFLDVVLHGVEKFTFVKWTRALKKGLEGSLVVARWFLEQLCSNDGGAMKTWMSDFMLNCSVKVARIAFKELVLCSIRVVAAHDSGEMNALRDAVVASASLSSLSVPSLSTTSSILVAVCDDLLSLVGRCHGFWQRWAQLFETIAGACTVPRIVDLFRVRGAVSAIVNVYLNIDAPDALQVAYGRVGFLGNQYNTPNYNSPVMCVSALLGVDIARAPLTSPGQTDSLVRKHGLPLTPKAVRAFCYLFSLAAGAPAAYEPFQKLATATAHLSASERDAALAGLSLRATSGSLERQAGQSGSALAMTHDQWMDYMLTCTNGSDVSVATGQVLSARDAPRLLKQTAQILGKYGDGKTLSLSGFLLFYRDACRKDPRASSAWNALSLHDVCDDLSLPGIYAREGYSDRPSSRHASITLVPSDVRGRHDGKGGYPGLATPPPPPYKIYKAHIRGFAAAASQLPALCSLAVRSAKFLEEIASRHDSEVVAAVLDKIVSSDPLFAPQLVPVIIQLVQDHAGAYNTKSKGHGDEEFIGKCVDIIAPLLTPPLATLDTAAEEQQDLGRVAEWFLFGAPPTDAGEPREPTLQDDGFLGAAKVYADHSRQSLQNFDEGRTAYKLVCIVERLYRCVPSCRRILDVTSAHAMARHTPERQAALIKYSWDWVVEFAKHCSVQRYMGGDDRNCVRNSRSVSIIDSLVRIHNSTGLYPAEKIPPTPFMAGVDYQGACHDSVAKEISNGNTCYVVSGSGSTFCDGEYTLDGYFDSVPKWSKSCVVTLTDKKGRKVEQSMTLTLFRVQMQNKQSRQWYLSKMDPLKPGTSKDVDYYCCSSQTECPPKIGWRKIGNGRDPAPVSVRGNADMARRAELNQRSRGHSVSSDDSSGEEEYRGEEKWQDRSGGGDGRFPAAPSAPRVANICLPGDGVDPYPTSSDDVNSTEPAGSGSDDPNLDGFSDDEVAQNRDNLYSMI